ncbi:hypothetical protein TNCV_3847361 [Trichonephila clavipes]|nr:hypothetical protein TNCV_3847361 [Trichonephila clavipes]
MVSGAAVAQWLRYPPWQACHILTTKDPPCEGLRLVQLKSELNLDFVSGRALGRLGQVHFPYLLLTYNKYRSPFRYLITSTTLGSGRTLSNTYGRASVDHDPGPYHDTACRISLPFLDIIWSLIWTTLAPYNLSSRVKSNPESEKSLRSSWPLHSFLNRDPPDTPQQSELGEVVHYHPSE